MPAPTFRPPVLVRPSVINEICRLARDGYETPGKRESFGFLYGTLNRQGRLELRQVIGYRGGRKTRTGTWFADSAAVTRALRRREELGRKLGMRFLGGFHSHVEIAGRVFRGISPEDRHAFLSDKAAFIEAIASVWAGGRTFPPDAGRHHSNGYPAIAACEEPTGYSYRVRLYARTVRGIRLCPVTLPGRIGSLLLT